MDALLSKKITNMHLENRLVLFFIIMLTLILHACFLYLFMLITFRLLKLTLKTLLNVILK